MRAWPEESNKYKSTFVTPTPAAVAERREQRKSFANSNSLEKNVLFADNVSIVSVESSSLSCGDDESSQEEKK